MKTVRYSLLTLLAMCVTATLFVWLNTIPSETEAARKAEAFTQWAVEPEQYVQGVYPYSYDSFLPQVAYGWPTQAIFVGHKDWEPGYIAWRWMAVNAGIALAVILLSGALSEVLHRKWRRAERRPNEKWPMSMVNGQ